MNQEMRELLGRISERLKKEYAAEKVVLYGSYARGQETEDSDIDILVVAPAKERMFERMATVRGLIRNLRNGLPLSPIVLTPEEYKHRLEMGDAFIEAIVEEAIAL